MMKNTEAELFTDTVSGSSKAQNLKLFKSFFGVSPKNWKGFKVLAYVVFKPEKEKSYETEFTQNLTSFSKTEDMRPDKKNYQHGVSNTYKQVSGYVIKRGRNIRNVTRPMVC